MTRKAVLPEELASPVRPTRPAQDNVPPTRRLRGKLLAIVREHVKDRRLVPPLSLEELQRHSRTVLKTAGMDAKYADFTIVLLNNEAWRDILAAVPYRRRLLLLPQCLRFEDKCLGTIDEFGLVCKHCRMCQIHDFQTEAQRLGYVVMVAEGATIAASLVSSGKVEAVVGASCLSVLERIFPHLEAGAVPGMAVPLLCDGCADTRVDADWLWDAIYLTSEDRTGGLNIEDLRRRVESWFGRDSLDAILGRADSGTADIARDWLERAGKRWRPFLAVCAFQALRDNPAETPPDGLRSVALAVECFHKASLIHDDIEDGDRTRGGRETLHAEYGVPVALNVGDFLLGEGYRLIAQCPAPPDLKARMIEAAALGHCDLCAGQGDELSWARDPAPLRPVEVLEICRRKTAPAFEVALLLGAAYAGADESISEVLSRYSDALGIAYQIRDDLNDSLCAPGRGDFEAMRPSILLSLAIARASGADAELLDAAWRRSLDASTGRDVRKVIEGLGARADARRLMGSYKERAIRALRPLASADLKALLRRVISKIFDDV